jgi:hypothetical protein
MRGLLSRALPSFLGLDYIPFKPIAKDSSNLSVTSLLKSV